ncbi:hypothetical protein EYF80_003090 [Liparis tanakae]|uniref:Uncharacterized protein n=1 Tax=Liparis tanakae TaxID=230148 RepID=A0A4Z2JBC7_9TELE|nr:hypothetical protein EYF80_003090 [Liparis tanakae]
MTGFCSSSPTWSNTASNSLSLGKELDSSPTRKGVGQQTISNMDPGRTGMKHCTALPVLAWPRLAPQTEDKGNPAEPQLSDTSCSCRGTKKSSEPHLSLSATKMTRRSSSSEAKTRITCRTPRQLKRLSKSTCSSLESVGRLSSMT